MRFTRMTTADKVNAGFVVALAIVAIIGIASITSIRRFTTLSSDVGHTYGVLDHLSSALVDLTQAESAQRGYLLTGETYYLEPYRTASSSVAQQIRSLREETFADERQQERLGMLGDLTARRLAIMSDIVSAVGNGEQERALAIVRSGRGKAVMDSVRAVAQAFEEAELTRLEQRVSLVSISGRVATTIIAAGGVFAFLVVFGSATIVRKDYTERRRAEFALRNSETLLSQFMENLPIGVVVSDLDSRLRFANNAAVDLVGPSVLIDTGDRPLPLYRRGDAQPYPETETPLARALQGQINSVEDAEIRIDGRKFPVEVSAAPIYDARGRIAYAIATFSDVTERRRAAEALVAAKEAAEEANRTKSDFLARMSHELRTPLNSVIGFANVLLKNRNGTLRPQELTFIERILENGKHLLRLINDILDLSKIEAGKIEVEREPTDLGELLRSVVNQLEPQVKHDVMELRTRIPLALEPIVSDAARMRQIMINLIGNALKFTERGYVEVVVETVPGTGMPARIRVRDTGIGIPPDRLDAIFDAFEQAESSTTRKFGGTGLGLPISRALCELLGYELTVASEQNVGTTFTVELVSREGALEAVTADAVGES